MIEDGAIRGRWTGYCWFTEKMRIDQSTPRRCESSSLASAEMITERVCSKDDEVRCAENFSATGVILL